MIVILRSHLAEALRDEADSEAVSRRQVAVAQERHHSRAEVSNAPTLVDHGHRQPNPTDRGSLPDPSQEAQVLAAAAERDVLPVVRWWRRITVALGERLNCAAERRSCLEQRDRRSLVGKIERRRETGEPATDHDGAH